MRNKQAKKIPAHISERVWYTLRSHFFRMTLTDTFVITVVARRYSYISRLIQLIAVFKDFFFGLSIPNILKLLIGKVNHCIADISCAHRHTMRNTHFHISHLLSVKVLIRGSFPSILNYIPCFFSSCLRMVSGKPTHETERINPVKSPFFSSWLGRKNIVANNFLQS